MGHKIPASWVNIDRKATERKQRGEKGLTTANRDEELASNEEIE
jgi:hypothetical protein